MKKFLAMLLTVVIVASPCYAVAEVTQTDDDLVEIIVNTNDLGEKKAVIAITADPLYDADANTLTFVSYALTLKGPFSSAQDLNNGVDNHTYSTSTGPIQGTKFHDFHPALEEGIYKLSVYIQYSITVAADTAIEDVTAASGQKTYYAITDPLNKTDIVFNVEPGTEDVLEAVSNVNSNIVPIADKVSDTYTKATAIEKKANATYNNTRANRSLLYRIYRILRTPNR